MSVKNFDSLRFTEYLYENNKSILGFKAKNSKEVKLWQSLLRKKIVHLTGGFPPRKCELMPRLLEKKIFPTYTREKVVFQSHENLSVIAYLLIPSKVSHPLPVIICLPGHGRGCDDIVGIKLDGKQRVRSSGYQKDFALQAVRKGFAALAIEQLGFGHRRDHTARKKGSETISCQPAAGAALLFGQTMIGWRVYDVIRAIDYLKERPEVDPYRIACMGISGGGTTTLFAAAIDSRIKVAVVSGYFNTFKDSIMSIPHCLDNYVPGILKFAEMYDVAGLIAPRALFIESGTKDPIFPVAATKLAFKKVKNIYRILGVEKKIDKEIFDGKHTFCGRRALGFLRRWL